MKSREDDNDPTEDISAEEKQKLKGEVEQLLSEFDSSSSRIYVLEMMRVLPRKSGRKSSPIVKISPEYHYRMGPILKLVDKVSHRMWQGPVTVEKCIMKRTAVLVAEQGKLENLGLGCESIWLREVESDEVFETKEFCLLLRPHEILVVTSDFTRVALQEGLSENENDARLAVLHAAGELLLDHLEEDIRLIPNLFAEVIEAIDEVLSDSDWLNLTRDDILNLSGRVVRRVDDG